MREFDGLGEVLSTVNTKKKVFRENKTFRESCYENFRNFS
jgi:hypothetical protein